MFNFKLRPRVAQDKNETCRVLQALSPCYLLLTGAEKQPLFKSLAKPAAKPAMKPSLPFKYFSEFVQDRF